FPDRRQRSDDLRGVDERRRYRIHQDVEGRNPDNPRSDIADLDGPVFFDGRLVDPFDRPETIAVIDIVENEFLDLFLEVRLGDDPIDIIPDGRDFLSGLVTLVLTFPTDPTTLREHRRHVVRVKIIPDLSKLREG